MAKRATKKSPARDLANDDIGEAKRKDLWRLLLECRLVEQRANDLFFQNLIKGTSHLGPVALNALQNHSRLPERMNASMVFAGSGRIEPISGGGAVMVGVSSKSWSVHHCAICR